MNGGKMLMRAVGMAGKIGSRHTARRTGIAGKMGKAGKTQPAEQQLQATPPAEQGNCRQLSQRILRPAQASQQPNGPQLAGRAAKTTAADDVGVGLSPCR